MACNYGCAGRAQAVRDGINAVKQRNLEGMKRAGRDFAEATRTGYQTLKNDAYNRMRLMAGGAKRR